MMRGGPQCPVARERARVARLAALDTANNAAAASSQERQLDQRRASAAQFARPVVEGAPSDTPSATVFADPVNDQHVIVGSTEATPPPGLPSYQDLSIELPAKAAPPQPRRPTRMKDFDTSERWQPDDVTTVPWVRLAGTDEPLLVTDEATQCISAVSTALSFVSVFGAARSGKSTLISFLCGIENIFPANPGTDSYTKGIDISSKFISLRDFSTSRGRSPSTAVEPAEGMDLSIGFADAEGQGDMGNQYDVKLVAGNLVVSRVTLFNWNNSFQKNKILDELAVMCEVAKRVQGGGEVKPFGHLHVVFQNVRQTEMDEGEAVRFEKLFGQERDNMDSATTTRNAVRKMLLESFQSITCQLLPKPVAHDSVYDINANVRKIIKFADLTPEYLHALAHLRASISKQLQVPRMIAGQPLRGEHVAKLMQEMAVQLTNGTDFIPASMYAEMLEKEEAERQRLIAEAEHEAEKAHLQEELAKKPAHAPIWKVALVLLVTLFAMGVGIAWISGGFLPKCCGMPGLCKNPPSFCTDQDRISHCQSKPGICSGLDGMCGGSCSECADCLGNPFQFHCVNPVRSCFSLWIGAPAACSGYSGCCHSYDNCAELAQCQGKYGPCFGTYASCGQDYDTNGKKCQIW